MVYKLDAQYSTVPLDEKTTAGVQTGELTTKEPFKHFLVIYIYIYATDKHVMTFKNRN